MGEVYAFRTTCCLLDQGPGRGVEEFVAQAGGVVAAGVGVRDYELERVLPGLEQVEVVAGSGPPIRPAASAEPGAVSFETLVDIHSAAENYAFGHVVAAVQELLGLNGNGIVLSQCLRTIAVRTPVELFRATFPEVQYLKAICFRTSLYIRANTAIHQPMKAFIFKASKEYVSTLEIDSAELLQESLSQIQAQFQLSPGDYIETSHQTFTIEKMEPPTGLPPENPPEKAMASDSKFKAAPHTTDSNLFLITAIACIGLLFLIGIFAPRPTPTAPVERGHISPEISSEVNLFVQTEIGKYFPRFGTNRISKYVYNYTEEQFASSPQYPYQKTRTIISVKELIEWKDPYISISRLQISEVDSLNGTTELYMGKWTIRFFRQWENDSQWSEWKPFETLKAEPSKQPYFRTPGRNEFYTVPPNFIVRKKDNKLLIEWMTQEDPSTHRYYPKKNLDFQNNGDEDRTRESILPK